MTSGSLMVRGRSTGIPSPSAASATGVGDGLPERPRALSGWVTATVTSWPPATSARSGATAACGLPAKATLMPRLLPFVAQRPEGLPALLRRRAVEDQHAVEVVELVLDDARLEALGLQRDRAAGDVLGLDPDRHRAGHVDRDLADRQAPLRVDLRLVRAPGDARVAEG